MIARLTYFRTRTGRFLLVALLGFLIPGLFAFAPWPTMTEVARADHDRMKVVCPSPITEGETAHLRLRAAGGTVEYAHVFTYGVGNEDFTADESDYEPYHGQKLEHKKGSRSVYIPIVTKEDDRPEHDETFAVGTYNDGIFHGCVITIKDDDMPEIEDVELSSRPVNGHTYTIGESIDVTVITDQPVDVEGDVLLALFIGEDGNSWRGARYYQGSGTRFLVFRYQVQVGDLDFDGLSVGSAILGDDRRPSSGFGGSGQINFAGSDVPIDYTHSGVSPIATQRVDGRPIVQSIRIVSKPSDGWTAYRANEVVEAAVNFNTEVQVNGDPQLVLKIGYDESNWDEATRMARYLRGSGSETLVFGYVVRQGDLDPRGVWVAFGGDENPLFGDGAISAEHSGVEPYPYYLGFDHESAHKIDAVSPAISSLVFTTRPANGRAYQTGETIKVKVAFSEPVLSECQLVLILDVGGVSRHATLSEVAASGEWAQFSYVIADGDNDLDGVGISANSLRLMGGSIHDPAGNALGLSHDVVPADPDQRVQTADHDRGPGAGR